MNELTCRRRHLRSARPLLSSVHDRSHLVSRYQSAEPAQRVQGVVMSETKLTRRLGRTRGASGSRALTYSMENRLPAAMEDERMLENPHGHFVTRWHSKCRYGLLRDSWESSPSFTAIVCVAGCRHGWFGQPSRERQGTRHPHPHGDATPGVAPNPVHYNNGRPPRTCSESTGYPHQVSNTSNNAQHVHAGTWQIRCSLCLHGHSLWLRTGSLGF